MQIDRLETSLSSKHWRWTFRGADECPATLLDCLRAKLEHIDRVSWPERLAFGGAFVNGLPAYADRPLAAPCWVEYYETKYDYREAAAIFPQFSKSQFVYLDEDLAVVAKPAGLPCFQAKEQRLYSMRSQLERYFGHPVHMPSRLDTSVCGLVAIGISTRAHDALQKIFERRQIEKIYLLQGSSAVTWQETLVDAPIGRDERHPILRRVVENDGSPAQTKFTLRRHIRFKGEGGAEFNTALVEARPITGRTHQIRVHAAHLGTPIIGDNFYLGISATELRLASIRVRFVHPFSLEDLDVCLPPTLAPQWMRELA